MNRECAELAELISALADGELAAADRERAERHLAECADCRRMAESFRKIEGALAGFPPPPAVEESRWERMLAEVKSAGNAPGTEAARTRRAVLKPAPVRAWRPVLLGVVAVAAAVALAVALLPHGGRGAHNYRSAESVSVDATGEGCQAVVMAAPEGGLNMVFVTSEDDSGERAGG